MKGSLSFILYNFVLKVKIEAVATCIALHRMHPGIQESRRLVNKICFTICELIENEDCLMACVYTQKIFKIKNSLEGTCIPQTQILIL